jgi:hypothetical protein
MNLERAGHGEFVFVGQLIDTQEGDDVLYGRAKAFAGAEALVGRPQIKLDLN